MPHWQNNKQNSNYQHLERNTKQQQQPTTSNVTCKLPNEDMNKQLEPPSFPATNSNQNINLPTLPDNDGSDGEYQVQQVNSKVNIIDQRNALYNQPTFPTEVQNNQEKTNKKPKITYVCSIEDNEQDTDNKNDKKQFMQQVNQLQPKLTKQCEVPSFPKDQNIQQDACDDYFSKKEQNKLLEIEQQKQFQKQVSQLQKPDALKKSPIWQQQYSGITNKQNIQPANQPALQKPQDLIDQQQKQMKNFNFSNEKQFSDMNNQNCIVQKEQNNIIAQQQQFKNDNSSLNCKNKQITKPLEAQSLIINRSDIITNLNVPQLNKVNGQTNIQNKQVQIVDPGQKQVIQSNNVQQMDNCQQQSINIQQNTQQNQQLINQPHIEILEPNIVLNNKNSQQYFKYTKAEPSALQDQTDDIQNLIKKNDEIKQVIGLNNLNCADGECDQQLNEEDEKVTGAINNMQQMVDNYNANNQKLTKVEMMQLNLDKQNEKLNTEIIQQLENIVQFQDQAKQFLQNNNKSFAKQMLQCKKNAQDIIDKCQVQLKVNEQRMQKLIEMQLNQKQE